MDNLACWDCTMENQQRTKVTVRNGLWPRERHRWPPVAPRLPLSFSLCLIIVGTALCVYYMYLSHIVYQIFISNSFKLNIFRTSLVAMLWITLKHRGTFIVVRGMCWLCAGTHVNRKHKLRQLFLMCIHLLFMFFTEYDWGPKAQNLLGSNIISSQSHHNMMLFIAVKEVQE